MMTFIKALVFLFLMNSLVSANDMPFFEALDSYKFQMYLENDAASIRGTDYHYSNGFQLKLIKGIDEFSLGHHLYTPQNKYESALITYDRPYAAWLYGTYARRWIRGDRLDTFELTVGFTGPHALGKQLQELIHKGVDNAMTVEGWDNQLESELTLMASWSSILRLNPHTAGFSWDFLPYVTASIGTPFTRLNIGAEARLGYNLDNDFSFARMSQAGGADLTKAKYTAYVFAGVMGSGVAYNTFLDGNLFHDSHSVDKKHFVYEVICGLSLKIDRFKIAATHVYKTKEFTTQYKYDTYGALSLSYAF